MASVSRSRSLPAVLKLAVGQVGGERERENGSGTHDLSPEASRPRRRCVSAWSSSTCKPQPRRHPLIGIREENGEEGGWFFFFLLDLVFGRASVQAVGFVAKILPIPKIVSPVFLISKKLAFSNYLAQLVDTTLVAKQIIP